MSSNAKQFPQYWHGFWQVFIIIRFTKKCMNYGIYELHLIKYRNYDQWYIMISLVSCIFNWPYIKFKQERKTSIEAMSILISRSCRNWITCLIRITCMYFMNCLSLMHFHKMYACHELHELYDLHKLS